MDSASLERLLRRDRLITMAGLAVLCLLAWLYIVAGAGLGMDAWEMTRFALFPHQQPAAAMPGMDMSGMDMPEMEMPGMDMSGMDMSAMDMPGMGALSTEPRTWGPAIWVLMIAMWWIMMIAMMSPSAAPTVLLYARVHRHALAQGQDKLAPTGVFVAGYLLVWLAFSVAATALYWLLERNTIISAVTMASQSRWLSAIILIAAGIYQLSPLKSACLSHCRAPAAFLSRHWRPGALGTLRLGALHGAFCVGCCWVLMALLFVGGVMNLVWIAALAILVLAEKVFPAGQWVGRAAGIALIAWGIATLLVE
jgi:predicted metal-binding membrane protein